MVIGIESINFLVVESMRVAADNLGISVLFNVLSRQVTDD